MFRSIFISTILSLTTLAQAQVTPPKGDLFLNQFQDPPSTTTGLTELDGWEFVKHLSAAWESSEILSLTATGNDPYMRRLGLNIDAAITPLLKVRMKHNEPNPSGQIRVFFITETDPTWGYGKSVAVSLEQTDAFTTYVVPMSNNQNWSGTITGLRIDPVDGATVGVDFWIDSIAMSGKEGPWLINTFNRDGDVEGWSSSSQSSITATGGTLEIHNLEGVQPYVRSADIDFEALDFTKLTIALQNGTDATQAGISFITSASTQWGTDKRITFSINPQDQQSRFYDIDFSNHPLWEGRILGFQLDVDHNFGEPNTEDKVWVDEIVWYETIIDETELLFDSDDLVQLREKSLVGRSAVLFSELEELADSKWNTGVYVNHAITARRAASILHPIALYGVVNEDQAYINRAKEKLYEYTSRMTLAKYKANGVLSMADAVHTLCIALDWLGPHMSAAEKTKVYEDIFTLSHFLYSDSVDPNIEWGDEEERRLVHNWNGVIHGALGLAALKMGRQDWLERATERCRAYLKYSSDSTGAGFEGAAYMGYGLQHVIPFAVALKRQGGPDILAESVGTMNKPNWLTHMTYPDGSGLIPLNQSGSALLPTGGIYHLIHKYSNQTALWSWLHFFKPGSVDGFDWSNDWAGNGASLPYVFLWDNPQLEALHPADDNVPLVKVFEKGEVLMRSSWDDDATLVSFTSGKSYFGNHGHADQNSFTLFDKGEPVIVDLGSGYGASKYHNIIFVDGEGQAWSGNHDNPSGKMELVESLPLVSHFRGSALHAYRNLNPIKATRDLYFGTDAFPYLVIYDHFVLNDQLTHNFEARYHLGSEQLVKIGGNQATFGNGKIQEATMVAASQNPVTLASNGTPDSPQISVTLQGNELHLLTVILPGTVDDGRIVSATLNLVGNAASWTADVEIPGLGRYELEFDCSGLEVSAF